MGHIEAYSEFETLACEFKNKYLSYDQRCNLIKQLGAAVDQCYLAGDKVRGDSLLRHYVWLGGSDDRVLDRLALLELEGDLSAGDSILLARLILRIAVDKDMASLLSPVQEQKLRSFFTDIVLEGDPAWIFIVHNPEAVKWIFHT